ncbi:MAG TPA: hypothetical protein VFM88_05305 [Vicinamibacteria bacterium]|nr:hypothetical protein [Vicinamibacteria bacterium]
MKQTWTPLERAGLGAAALVALLMAWTIVRVPVVSVDGRTLWGFHARLIHDTGRYPSPELGDPGFPIPHRQYPPLLPLLDAAALAALPVDTALRLVPWLSYLAVALLLSFELPRRDPERGRLLALAYALMPTLVLSEEGGADAGVADTLLGAWVLGAALLLDAGRPALAGVVAAAGALTKNEGLALGPLLLASAFVRCGDERRRFGPILRATLAFAALVLPWLWLRAAIPSGLDEGYLSRLTLEQLAAGAPRGPEVALQMVRVGFLHPQRAGLFWWLAVLLWWTSSRRAFALLDGRLAIVPAYVAILFVLYIVSPWPGVAHVQLSFERLLLHVAPLALLGLTARPAQPIMRI